MTTFPRIIAIETAAEACSVAFTYDNQIYSRFEAGARHHAEKILPFLDDMLKQQNLTLSDFDAIAFSCGPGSFTGVRIGVGIAQGLGFGANLPLIPLSTFLILAQATWEKSGAQRVLTAIDARMGEFYWAEYQRDDFGQWHGEETEKVITPEMLHARMKVLEGEWTTAGSGWSSLSDLSPSTKAKIHVGDVLLPAAKAMLPLALNAFEQGKTLLPENAEPIYLRKEISWKKLPGR